MFDQSHRLTRREVLAGAGALTAVLVTSGASGAAGLDAPAEAGSAFTRSTVADIARALSKTPFKPPPSDLPPEIADLTYDQYRAIYFKPEAGLWANEGLPFQVQFFHRGFYFKDQIDIATVADGRATHVPYSPTMYAKDAIVRNPLPTADIGFAGMRVHAAFNRPDYYDEVVVFQGASYFRSLGKGQIYGVSARGLALKTAEPEGEEFPIFRSFWVEKPVKDTDSLVVHALLDSPSTTGAYRFTIRPGMPTVIDVEAELFPRVDLVKVGLAPGTSMFYFSANGRDGFDDWRPEVHDSDGLLIINGRSERLWRPLANPKQLQVSAFVDAAPRGFGLMQRNRAFATYDDIVAQYQKRPSLWVEPVGDWGKGAVTLVEIPNDSETNDNIVAYWQPESPILAGSEFTYAYRLSWGDDVALPTGALYVADTRRGRGDLYHASPIRRFVIDYGVVGGGPLGPDPGFKPKVEASAGQVDDVLVEPNPVIGGWRITFNLDPKGADIIELRLSPMRDDGGPAETWLYRWTA